MDGRYDLSLQGMAADLIRRQVAVIFAAPGIAALAAKAATTIVPVIFSGAIDPVDTGLVMSLNRPGGNLTGATNLSVELAPKRVELLHEMVPTANVIALLINPTSATAQTTSRNFQAAAQSFGLELRVLQASAEHELDVAFTALVQLRANGLVIARELGGEVSPTKRDLEKEAQCSHRTVHRRWLNTALGLMNLIAAQVRRSSLVVVSGDGPEIWQRSRRTEYNRAASSR